MPTKQYWIKQSNEMPILDMNVLQLHTAVLHKKILPSKSDNFQFQRSQYFHIIHHLLFNTKSNYTYLTVKN